MIEPINHQFRVALASANNQMFEVLFTPEWYSVSHLGSTWIAQFNEERHFVSSGPSPDGISELDLIQEVSSATDGSLLHQWMVWKSANT